MHVTVTFRHMDSSDALRDYAEEKSARLARYLVEPIEIHWVLSVEKIRHNADVTAVAGGISIKAQENTPDMYSAIDMALDKLEKQVKKHKEKVKDHKPHSEPAEIKFIEPTVGAAGAGPRIVKKENIFVKPMSIEEAAMQMDVADNEFLVFTDSATSQINVIYRLEGGDYGLIEAETRAETTAGVAGVAGAGPRIAKKENNQVKSMSIEEAAMQMDVADNEFLVFTDSTTGQINVIYRLEGGDYGLIEAQTK